jgi:hypothetical protein
MMLPQTITLWLTDHRDGTGARITGETWTFAGCVDPVGDAFTPVVAEPFNDGRYRFQWSADAYGDWLFEVQAQSHPADSDYHYSAVITVEDEAVAILGAPTAGYASGTAGAKLAQIGASAVTVNTAIATDQSLTLVQGDAYEGDSALSWANNGWSIPADATITLSATYAGQTVTFAGTRISATVVSVDLSALHTAALVPGRAHYRYRIIANDDILVTGAMSVTLG